MNYSELNNEVETLVTKITGSLRGTMPNGKKKLEKKAIKQLFLLLNSHKEHFRTNEMLNKRFVALLFYLYVQVNAEAMHTNFPDPVFQLAGEIENLFSELFGPAFM